MGFFAKISPDDQDDLAIAFHLSEAGLSWEEDRT
jgi:hypothetical protein